MGEATRTLKKWMGHGIAVERRGIYSALMTLAISLMLTLAGANLHVAQAQGTITRCEPEAAYVPTNEQATVCIYVQDVPEAVGLYGADFEMSFPGMVGIATIVDEDTGSPGVQILRNWTWIPSGFAVFANTANNSGKLNYTTYGWNPAPAVSGSGPIACMRFQPLGTGTFTMTFTRHDLSNRDGLMIPDTAHTCSVTFVGPTAVSVTRFTAQAEGRNIHVQWETAQETGTLGFNLYRSATEAGPKTQLNRKLIPSQMPPGPHPGAVYDWIDKNRASPRRTLYYWLEEVDIYGHATMHGPAKVSWDRTTE